MAVSRRTAQLFLFLAFIVVLCYNRALPDRTKWRDRAQKIAEHVGLGDHWNYGADGATIGGMSFKNPRFTFVPGQGKLKPPGSIYSRALVVPKTKDENVTWMYRELPDVEKKIYSVDNMSAPLHAPVNKGHEVMVYLTYIIDHYDDLPDVMIFMHAHQIAWHNNDVLGNDAAEMVRRLSSERVTRQGYMNLRCQWHPGCPDWMHPGNADFDAEKSEQFLIARAWAEIFPGDPIPDVLAQPCCSQFALSKELIQSVPKARFISYRDWVLNTRLRDYISGRVWEYLWQYAFTGVNAICPNEFACYCDGYGVCFEDQASYKAWFDLRTERDHINTKLFDWEEQAARYEDALDGGRQAEADIIGPPIEGLGTSYKHQLAEVLTKMQDARAIALMRGDNPDVRAAARGMEP